METIIEFNNEFLVSLRKGDYSNAIQIATVALHGHRSHLKHSDVADTSICGKQDGLPSRGVETEITDCDYLDRCMLLSEITESNEEAPGTFHNHQGCFIYKHGISLQKAVTDHADVVSAILIFNSALAYHMYAMHHRRPEKLHKARRLYELAYDGASDILDNNLLFQFAVINNLAMIDQQLGNTARNSENCLSYLLSIYMIFVDQGCDMHLQHVSSFLVNLPSSTIAAASTAVAA